ncbi:hypothetical protein H2199_001874 [Coniosporium tulheliwenetii]|uniref:Uncharacterized protein n=1 Tax=Coniosporium tulheliwenetii TaxID=3383036 RepID=A0ACC2ZKH9_9PEZI|nr:hypothetical protein H2199_001874 [Cladosporium sp. JES 115]
MSDNVASPYDDTEADDTADAGGRDEPVGLDISLTGEGGKITIPEVIVATLENEELTPTASNPHPTDHQLIHVADSRECSSDQCTGAEAAASDETGSPDSGWSDSSSEDSSSDGEGSDEAESDRPTDKSPDLGCSDSSDDSDSDSDSKSDSHKIEANSDNVTPKDEAALPVAALADEAVDKLTTLTLLDSSSDDSDSESPSVSKSSEDEVVNKYTSSDDAAALPTSAPPDGAVDEHTAPTRSDPSSDTSGSWLETQTDSANEEVELKDSTPDNATAQPAPKTSDTATGKYRISSSSETSSDDSDPDTEHRSKKAKSGSKAAPPPSFNPDEEAISLINKGLPYTEDNLAWFYDFPAAYWVGSIRAGRSDEPGDDERPWPMLRMIQYLDPKPRKAGRDLITHRERRASLAGPSRPRSRLDVTKAPEELAAEAEAEAAAKAVAEAQLKAAKMRRRGSAPAVHEGDIRLIRDFEGFGAFAGRDNGGEIKAPRSVRPASGRHRPVTWHGGPPNESTFEMSPSAPADASTSQAAGTITVSEAAVTVDTSAEWRELWPDKRETLTPSRTTRSPQDEINSLEREKIRAFEKFRDAGRLAAHSSLQKWADPAVRLPVEREWRMELERELQKCRKTLADTVKELKRRTQAHQEANERIAELKKRIKELEEKLKTTDNPPQKAPHQAENSEKPADGKSSVPTKSKEETELAERIDRLASSILAWFDYNHMMNDFEGRMPTKSEVKDSLASSCTFSDFCQSLLDTGVKFEIDELAKELRIGNISTAPELEALSTAGGKSLQEQIAELKNYVKRAQVTVEELINRELKQNKLLELKQAEVDAAVENAKKEYMKRTAAFNIREGALLQQVQRLKEKNDSLARENETAAELKNDFTALQGQFLDVKSQLLATQREKLELQKRFLLLEQDLRRCESLRAQPNTEPAGCSDDVQALNGKCASLELQLQKAHSELDEANIKMLDALAERDDALAKWESFTGSEEAVQLGEMYLEIEQLQRSLTYTQQCLEYTREINRDFHGQIEDLRIERGLLLTRLCGNSQEQRVDEGAQGIFALSRRAYRAKTKKELVYERMREERVAETMARLLEWQGKDYEREVRWRRMFGEEMEPNPAESQGLWNDVLM